MELQEEQQHAHHIVSTGNKRMIRNTQRVMPHDILFDEILTRLPANYLARFQRVCKSWKHIFSTPEFVKAHFTRQQSVTDQDLLIGHKYKSEEHNYYPNRNHIQYTNNPDYRVIIIISRSSEIPITAVPWCSDILLGSINGLVCMASGNNFCLWNPAMGQIKDICFPSRCSKDCLHLVGFSWDHVSDDYKVVIVCYVSTFSTHLYIYSCKSASWTQLLITDNVVRDQIDRFRHRMNKKVPCTIVKGLTYWSYSMYKYEGAFMYVFKFVAENNEFRLLPHIQSDFYRFHEREFNLVNVKDSLVGMVYIKGCLNCLVDMYYLDEESDSGVWSKMYTIGPINLSDQNWCLSQCFKNGGEILIVKDGLLFFSDPKTEETQIIKSTQYAFIGCYSYTPSLVCVPGMEAIHLFSSQEMQLKKLAIEYSNLVGRSKSSTDSSSSSDSDAEAED